MRLIWQFLRRLCGRFWISSAAVITFFKHARRWHIGLLFLATAPSIVAVPRGSVLGRHVFVVYTKSLCLVVTNHNTCHHLCVDDTRVFYVILTISCLRTLSIVTLSDVSLRLSLETANWSQQLYRTTHERSLCLRMDAGNFWRLQKLRNTKATDKGRSCDGRTA